MTTSASGPAGTPAGPLLIGTAGMGGYAGVICRLLLEQSRGAGGAGPLVRLAAICEPDPDAHPALSAELEAAGVPVLARWEDLLARPAEAVWLPLPIPLHRPYTEQALAAGLAVMCEKPAAGCVQDLDAMQEAQNRAGLPVAIGFQDIHEPATLALKRALLAGGIGAVRSVTLTACWPRDSRYYARSAWAGRRRQGGAWVMDSPASNALAHYLNLALFLLGDSLGDSAVPAGVEAELYRANPIETYDTCGLRLVTASGVPLLALLTHACRETRPPRIVMEGTSGSLHYEAGAQAEIRTPRGAQTFSLREASRTHMLRRFASLVRGVPDEQPVATLVVARAHLIAVNGASEAAPVHAIPPQFFNVLPSGEGGRLTAISGIEDLFQACAERHCLPHETGLTGWTAPGGARDLRGYSFFAGPAEEES